MNNFSSFFFGFGFYSFFPIYILVGILFVLGLLLGMSDECLVVDTISCRSITIFGLAQVKSSKNTYTSHQMLER